MVDSEVECVFRCVVKDKTLTKDCEFRGGMEVEGRDFYVCAHPKCFTIGIEQAGFAATFLCPKRGGS